MGGGVWTSSTATTFVTCNYAAHGVRSFDDLKTLNVHQIYTSSGIDPMLDPKGVIRECRDSEEHPNTVPVILALDVTGSMGDVARNCAAKLNDVMVGLFDKVKDVEFMTMGIGDLSFDRAPIQATQFESDVRILDQATKVYFEAGGGANLCESYTAAWYFGLYRTKLDCWDRGKKGIIITLGDEPLNPYLPGAQLSKVLGINTQDVETRDLYEEASKKFDIYHIVTTDKGCCSARYMDVIKKSWGSVLGERCLYANSEDLDKIIGEIIQGDYKQEDGISW